MTTSRGILPRRHPELEVVQFGHEYVAFDPRCLAVHLVSGLLAVVFDACDGVTFRSAVVDELVETLDVEATLAERLVTENLSALQLRGLLVETRAQQHDS